MFGGAGGGMGGFVRKRDASIYMQSSLVNLCT